MHQDQEITYDEALSSLKKIYGQDANFRPYQWEAIDAVVNKRKKLLLVQSTGWGKSLVYFLSTRILRNKGYGPTIIISPLISLMRDQIHQASKKIGLKAMTINSNNEAMWPKIEEIVKNNACDILLISPERLGNEYFVDNVLPYIQENIGLFVVDEAHCISDWGHDFRPDYRRIVRIIKMMPSGTPLLTTTATANNRVVEDIREQIGKDLVMMRGPLARKSLRLKTITLSDQAERLAWLVKNVPLLPGSGIIYCLTVKDCEMVASYLKDNGVNVEPYHSKLREHQSQYSREELEDKLKKNQIKALVATIALGMGFDKPDIGFVIHYQRPGSLIAYYQQVGRAGRNIENAYAILLSGREDDDIAEYFIRNAFPTGQHMKSVLDVLEESENGASVEKISLKVNLTHTKIKHCLKHLEIEGAVTKEYNIYYRTTRKWEPDIEKAQLITLQRYDELDEIRNFVTSKECLMRLVCKKLDDPFAEKCGRCSNCDVIDFTDKPDSALLQDTVDYIKNHQYPIMPRKKWPDGKYIENKYYNLEGRSLCIYGDGGWGRMVRDDKYDMNRFRDELVKASTQTISSWLDPLPDNLWVTAVPSLRRPGLVPGFGRRLADDLGLLFVDAIEKVKETQAQKEMENSAMQYGNVIDAFDMICCRPGPVLLIDDVVDSRWTLTICGYKLRCAGSGPVYPFTLANATKG